jgi:hypothetical protein
VLHDAVDASGRITDPALRAQTGWQTIHAFVWVLELADPQVAERFAAVDSGRTFRHDQRFRLRIGALTDLYVYVLVRNADGSEELLLPERQEPVPLIRRGQSVSLPKRDAFRFRPPAGTEQLRLLVSPMKLPWVAPADLWKITGKERNGEALTEQEQAVIDQLKAIRAREIAWAIDWKERLPASTTWQAAWKSIRDGGLPRGAEVVAVDTTERTNLVTHTSARANSRPVIVHDIFLRHAP